MPTARTPFVARVHVEPEEARQDVVQPPWETLNALLETLGLGPAGRLELHSLNSANILTVEGHGNEFHLSIQIEETDYYCLRPNPTLVGQIRDLGPFAFEASEVWTNREGLIEHVRTFWQTGGRHGEQWVHYDASNGLSPLNNNMAKAAAEIGAMNQAFEAGKRGGEATLRVQGKWNATPATKADMKFMARLLDLTALAVTDADGTFYSFKGKELLPVRFGGKAWIALCPPTTPM